MNRIKSLIKNVIKRVIFGKYHQWHSRLTNSRREYQEKYYSHKAARATNEKYIVVCMFDGRCFHGGLSDRLRGITTIYQACKELGVDFRINFTSPFDLEKIFRPNKVDWRIKADEVSYNIDDAVPYNIVDATYQYPLNVQKQFIRKIITSSSKYRQLHIYCNADVTHQDGSYTDLFNELFVTSDYIEKEVEKNTKIIGSDYICVATRFCSLLGDFEDVNMGELSESQQEILLDDCIEQLELIHAKYPDKYILITSDSRRFMDRTSKLDYTYFINGQKVNIDRTDVRDFNILKNSIVDFFLISNASRIIQIRKLPMYGGFFAQSASYLKNVPFEMIEF